MSKFNKEDIISKAERSQASKQFSENEIEYLCKSVHLGWFISKRELGFHHPSEVHKNWDSSQKEKICEKCHLDLVPYDQLEIEIQELDHTTVEMVIAGLKRLGYKIQKE